MNIIRKFTSILIIITLLCSIMTPIVSAASGSFPTLIYLAADFEGQQDGELPWGFNQSHFDTDVFMVSTMPVEGKENNKVLRFNGTELANRSLRHCIEFYPITHDFVFGMDVNFTDTSAIKKIILQVDTTYPGCNPSGRDHREVPFIDFSEMLKVGGSIVSGVQFEKNKWYRIDLVVRVDEKKADLYLNGKLTASSIKLNDMESVCGIEFEAPNVGSDYHVDNIKLYKSESIMSDAEFNAVLEDWKASDLYPREKYSNGRLYAWDKILYNVLKGKTVAKIESSQMWVDNKVTTMSAPIIMTDGKLEVPVRSFGEMFGARIEWDSVLNKATIVYNGKKLEYLLGSDVYYDNGRMQKMTKTAETRDGVLYLPIELMVKFLDFSYYVDDQLISFGEKLVMDPELNPDRYLTCCQWTHKDEVFWRIGCLLTHELPSAEELLEDFYQKNPEGKHPRVETDSFEQIKERMKTDPDFAKVVEQTIENGRKEYDSPLVEYRQLDYISYSIGAMCEKMRKLAFTYVMTKEEKYKEKLVEQMKLVYEAEDFTKKGQYLTIGTTGWYLGDTYDWMYDYFTEEERKMCVDIILRVLSSADYGLAASNYIGGSNHLGKGHNWNMIISNGWLSCCSAIMDEYPELSSEITEGLIRSATALFEVYAPYGVCLEGVSYWLYTCSSMVPYLNTLESTFGTDYGVIEAPGILKMFDYARSVEGATTSFNLGDATPQSPTHAILWKIGEKTNNSELINYRRKSAGDSNDIFSWVFETDENSAGGISSDLDVYFGSDSSVTMRTGWSRTDTAVYFHGGGNNDPHSHYDIGNVLFDMNGERWGDELVQEEYGMGALEINKDYKGGYFRNTGEGHNVVIANLSAENNFGMDKLAKAKIEVYSFGDIESFAIMDLTEGNPLYKYGIRGVKLNKLTNELLIQDDYKTKIPTHFWWFMNFKNTEIDVSEDGKSAILSRNNKKIVATIKSEGDEKFQILEAKPLEHLTHLKAPYESPNEGYLRLGINNPNTDHFSISVIFRPYDENSTNEIVSDSSYMSVWQAITSDRAKLSSVTVDGVPLEGFTPETYTYDIELMTEKDPVPKIEVQANSELEVSISEATTVPGITTVKLTKAGTLVGMYNFGISALNDTRLFLNEKQIPIKSFSVTSEPETQNPGKNLFDGSKDTKYATNENGGAVTIDFGKIQKVDEVKMAFTNGAIRKEFFTIEYSTDGINWQLVYDGAGSGQTTDYQSFDVGLIDAQYLRVKFFGNSNASDWVSVSELCAFTQ